MRDVTGGDDRASPALRTASPSFAASLRASLSGDSWAEARHRVMTRCAVPLDPESIAQSNGVGLPASPEWRAK